jgi:hypothetical protein
VILIQGGDILFYAVGEKPDIYDEAIIKVTDSKWVHVAVALNQVQKIEALSGGVMINYLDNRQVDSIWRFSGVNPLTLHNALNWLTMQKGNSYSWGDAANVLLNYLHSPIELAENNLVYCSGLATEFLQKCGYTFPTDSTVVDAHKMTPGLLATYLGIK